MLRVYVKKEGLSMSGRYNDVALLLSEALRFRFMYLGFRFYVKRGAALPF